MHRLLAMKLVALRCLVRLAILGLVVLLCNQLPIEEGLNAYIDWAATHRDFSVLLFLAACIPFNGISPTGYLTTVLAGATFELWIAFPVAYVNVNAGAMLNLLLVRRQAAAATPAAAQSSRSGRRPQELSRVDTRPSATGAARRLSTA